MSYAKGTTVSPERSLAEIRRLVAGAGATGWKFGEDDERILIGFTLKGLDVRLVQPLPTLREFAARRSAAQQRTAHAAEVRRRWRVLLLRLKVRFELVADGTETPAQAFGSYLVQANGATVEETALAQLPAPSKMLKGG
ncbi:MAG TPA: hypothetical protein VGE07_10600 [Herpetosiphonaceae bacterium]